eukprot:gene4109-5141_t
MLTDSFSIPSSFFQWTGGIRFLSKNKKTQSIEAVVDDDQFLDSDYSEEEEEEEVGEDQTVIDQEGGSEFEEDDDENQIERILPLEKKFKKIHQSNIYNSDLEINNNNFNDQEVPMMVDSDSDTSNNSNSNNINSSELDAIVSDQDTEMLSINDQMMVCDSVTTTTTTSTSPPSFLSNPFSFFKRKPNCFSIPSLVKHQQQNNNNINRQHINKYHNQIERDRGIFGQNYSSKTRLYRNQQQQKRGSIGGNKEYHIEDFPLEVLVHIFSFLDHQEIGFTIPLVNKNFQEISNIVVLWKDLFYRYWNFKSSMQRKKGFYIDPNTIILNTNRQIPLVLDNNNNNNNLEIQNNNNSQNNNNHLIIDQLLNNHFYNQQQLQQNKEELESNSMFRDYKSLYKKRHIIEKNWKKGICSVQTLYGHQDGVWGVQFHKNLLVSGCEDGVMKVWDINEGECLNTLIGHNDVVNSFHFEGNRIVSGSDDSTLKMWDPITGKCLNTFYGHTGSVWMLEFKDNWLISGGDDRVVRIWDMNTGKMVQNLIGHVGRIYYIQMGENLVVSGAQDKSCRVWDIRCGQAVHNMVSNSPVHCLQVNGNLWNGGGDWSVASGHNNGSISVWNMRTGSLQAMLSNPLCCPVWHIQFRKNVIYTSSCNDLHAWNLNLAVPSTSSPTFSESSQQPQLGQLTRSKIFKGHTKSIKHFQVKDNRLVSGGLDNKIKVWDLEKPGNNYLYTLVGHTKSVDWLEFKKDKLISGSADHTIKIWDFYN